MCRSQKEDEEATRRDEEHEGTDSELEEHDVDETPTDGTNDGPAVDDEVYDEEARERAEAEQSIERAIVVERVKERLSFIKLDGPPTYHSGPLIVDNEPLPDMGSSLNWGQQQKGLHTVQVCHIMVLRVPNKPFSS